MAGCAAGLVANRVGYSNEEPQTLYWWSTRRRREEEERIVVVKPCRLLERQLSTCPAACGASAASSPLSFSPLLLLLVGLSASMFVKYLSRTDTARRSRPPLPSPFPQLRSHGPFFSLLAGAQSVKLERLGPGVITHVN